MEGLDSAAFLAALRRFMAQKGRCVKIYSDNGNNFVGAQKDLNTPIKQSVPILVKEGLNGISTRHLHRISVAYGRVQ